MKRATNDLRAGVVIPAVWELLFDDQFLDKVSTSLGQLARKIDPAHRR